MEITTGLTSAIYLE